MVEFDRVNLIMRDVADLARLSIQDRDLNWAVTKLAKQRSLHFSAGGVRKGRGYNEENEKIAVIEKALRQNTPLSDREITSDEIFRYAIVVDHLISSPSIDEIDERKTPLSRVGEAMMLLNERKNIFRNDEEYVMARILLDSSAWNILSVDRLAKWNSGE